MQVVLFEITFSKQSRFLANKDMHTMVEEHNQKIASTGRDETMEY